MSEEGGVGEDRTARTVREAGEIGKVKIVREA
jgi:hypothetical protein